MNPARSASPPPVGSTGLVSGTAITSSGSSPAAATRTPSAARVVTQVPTRASTSSAVQPVFCISSGDSYSLVNSSVGAVDQVADHLAVGPGQLLARVGGEGGSRGRGTPAVCRTIAVGSFGPIDDEVEARRPGLDRRELDLRRPRDIAPE